MRDEQTHPHRPRLVVSHSTCPPLSSQLRGATLTSLFIALPPLNPAQLRVLQQDEANVPVSVRQSIDDFDWEPGLSPDLRLLHLHPTGDASQTSMAQ